MPLTPTDVHNVAFKKPPIGKRGYDEEEVDAFLDEVEHELTRLAEENRSLRGQVERVGGGTSPAAATVVISSEVTELRARLDQLREAKAKAEQNARSVQAQLEHARNTAPPAPSSGDSDDRNARVLMMAQRTADDHIGDARRESATVLGDARDKAKLIVSEAQIEAATLESEARRRHTEAMNGLENMRNALQLELKKLGQLEESYRAALQSHLTQQLEELDSAPKLTIMDRQAG